MKKTNIITFLLVKHGFWALLLLCRVCCISQVIWWLTINKLLKLWIRGERGREANARHSSQIYGHGKDSVGECLMATVCAHAFATPMTAWPPDSHYTPPVMKAVMAVTHRAEHWGICPLSHVNLHCRPALLCIILDPLRCQRRERGFPAYTLPPRIPMTMAAAAWHGSSSRGSLHWCVT